MRDLSRNSAAPSQRFAGRRFVGFRAVLQFGQHESRQSAALCRGVASARPRRQSIGAVPPEHLGRVIGRTLAVGLCGGLIAACHASDAVASLGGTRARDTAPCLTPGPVTLAPSPIALSFVAPSEVRAGVSTTFAISAKNTSNRAAVLPTALHDQTFNVLVHRTDSTTVWDRLAAYNGGFIADVAVLQPLAPGAEVRFEAVWDQHAQSGAAVPPGEYSVFGVLYTDLADDQPGHCYRSEPHRLVITR